MIFLSASQRLEREGDELTAADRHSEAILAYHQAVTADNNNRSALLKLAPLFYGQGRTRDAGEIISKLSGAEKAVFTSGMSEVVPENLDHLELQWIKSPGVDTPIGITADSDMVVAAYQTGLIASLRLQDGTILWSQKLSETLTSPPALSSNSIFVGSESGKVIALDRKTGDIIWQAQLPGAVYAGLLIDGLTGYIGSYGGVMSAIRLADGKILWQVETGSPILASAMKEASTIFFGTVGGSVYSVDATNGNALWEKPAQLPGGIESQPVLAGNRLLISNNDSRLYVLDLNGKDYFWAYSTPDSIYANPIVDGNRVYLFSIGQTAAAVDLATGSLIWEQDLPVAVGHTPVLAQSVIYFAGTTLPFLYEMDSLTGKITGQANTGDWIEYGPIQASEYLLLAGKDGAILDYRIIED
ncbi:MAG: PQQ-binding-like beta-propeller repeat protein [Leptolinea sp.]